jgi:hypothetical protein
MRRTQMSRIDTMEGYLKGNRALLVENNAVPFAPFHQTHANCRIAIGQLLVPVSRVTRSSPSCTGRQPCARALANGSPGTGKGSLAS